MNSLLPIHVKWWCVALVFWLSMAFSQSIQALQIQENESGYCSADGVVETSSTGYTGTGYLNLDNAGSAGVTYNVEVPNSGNYTITFRHAGDGSTGMKMRVNGGSSFSFSLTRTASYSDWTTTSQSVALTAGTNTIFYQNSGDSARPYIDYMEIDGGVTAVNCAPVQLQELETGFCGANGTLAYDAGYTGAGTANLNDETNAAIWYRVDAPSAGYYDLTFRHYGGTSSDMGMVVNDGSAFWFRLPVGQFWQLTTQSVYLFEGINTVGQFSTSATARPNIDYLEVAGGVTPVYCGFGEEPASLAAFDIDVGGGSGSTCTPFNISIAVKDASNATVTDYTGNVTLTTSSGNGLWSKTATASDALGVLTAQTDDSGNASYLFDSSDAGTITLQLSNPHAETLTVTVLDAEQSVASTSANLSFGDNAFVVSFVDDLGTDFIAGRSHSVQVDMYQKDPATGVCEIASGYNTANIKAYVSRTLADPGGAAPTATNSAATDSTSLPSSAPGAANFALDFSGGTARLSLLASDVGTYALNFLDDSAGYSDTNIQGSSINITARPFGFYLWADGNGAAVDHNGAKYVKAGQNFSVTATAVAWQAADDANDDGIADGHNNSNPLDNTDLSNNAALPSFGLESPAEGLALNASVYLPNSGTGSLGGNVLLTGFSGGSKTAELSFSDVGIIELSARVADGDYLGTGVAVTSSVNGLSGPVGRFYPAHFVMSNQSITAACTVDLDFSYLGQVFEAGLRLTAMNAAGATCGNYQGDFAKLSSASLASSLNATDPSAAAALSGRLSASVNTFAWASGVLDASMALAVARQTAPDGPFMQAKIGAMPTDTDGVTVLNSALNLDTDNNASNDSETLGETVLRQGRLLLSDSFGPETANLPVNFVTQYWSGLEWVTNTADSCTVISLSDITYPDGALDTAANRTVAVGGGSSTGQYASINTVAIDFLNGDAGHYFTPPGSSNTGSIDVSVGLSNYPWLMFDWDNDGDYSEASLPTATFTFGSYRGHDRVLYWQEVLQD